MLSNIYITCTSNSRHSSTLGIRDWKACFDSYPAISDLSPCSRFIQFTNTPGAVVLVPCLQLHTHLRPCCSCVLYNALIYLTGKRTTVWMPCTCTWMCTCVAVGRSIAIKEIIHVVPFSKSPTTGTVSMKVHIISGILGKGHMKLVMNTGTVYMAVRYRTNLGLHVCIYMYMKDLWKSLRGGKSWWAHVPK